MIPASLRAARVPGASPALRSLALSLLLLATVTGCGATASPSPRFNPTGPCTTDGKAAGAYPLLEVRIPKMLGGKAPQTLDSGRNCSAANLATLANHGIKEVRFAGGVWPDSNQSGFTLAVFSAPGLTAEWIGEWYEVGARAARSTQAINPSRPTVAGRQAYRLDLVNGESSQTVIAWPSSSGDVVQVIIAADESESRIQAALAAFP